MIRYSIRRISIFPAFKFGCLVGGVIMMPPGLLLGLLARALIGILRAWLEAWDAWTLDLAGRTIANLDWLEVLELADFLRQLQTLDDQGWLLVLALALAVALAGGLLAGLLATLGAVAYNIVAAVSGGLAVSAEMLGGPVTPVAAPSSAKESPASLPRPQAGPVTWLALAGNPQQRWPLKPGITALGSAPDNDVVLAGLAPRHAEVRFEAGRYVLYDLGSHQTWVNDRPIIGPNMLKEGFRVRLGSHELVFRRRET